ncbi:MAG: hypothetical protein WBV39_16530 [Rudaea sp.]
MKTTLDLPDDLMRRVKIRAVHENKKLKDEMADLLERALAVNDAAHTKAFVPKPTRLRGGFQPTTDDIEAAIANGRD